MENTTKRNIAYTLEVNSFHNFNTVSTLEVTAITEEGGKDFTLTLDNSTGEINEYNVNEFLNDADLTEVEEWVDATVISYLSSELQKWCIRNAELGKYYSFYIYTFNACNAVVNGLECDRLNFNGKSFLGEQLTGVEQIKQFLNKA